MHWVLLSHTCVCPTVPRLSAVSAAVVYGCYSASGGGGRRRARVLIIIIGMYGNPAPRFTIRKLQRRAGSINGQRGRPHSHGAKRGKLPDPDHRCARSLGWGWYTCGTHATQREGAKRNGLRCLEAGARCHRAGENAESACASTGSSTDKSASATNVSENGTSSRRTGVRTCASRRSASADDKATAQTSPLTRERTGRRTHAGVS